MAATGRPRGRPRGSTNRRREQQNEGSEKAPRTGISNSAARRSIITKACREITDLETQRKAIGAKITEIKQGRIKGDLAMKIADFNAALRLYRLEGEDRDAFFDTLRETFAALGIGAQLDFMDVMEAEEPASGKAKYTVPEQAINAARAHLGSDDEDEDEWPSAGDSELGQPSAA